MIPADGSPASWRVIWDTRSRPEAVIVAAEGVRAVEVVTSPGGTRVAVAGFVADLPGSSPAAAVAARYEAAGEESLDELRGAYSIALWSPSARQLLLTRDHIGLVPCFFSFTDGLLVASPHLDEVLANLAGPAQFDGRMVAENALGVTSRAALTRSLYAGVSRLAPGHVATVSEAGIASRRYWQFPQELEQPSAPERFEELFTRAVERCVAAGADAIALSGGYDSVGIALVASSRVDRLTACSLAFGDPACDESAMQRAIARRLGLPLVIEQLRSPRRPNLVEAALAESKASPIPIPGVWRGAYSALLENARGQGVRGLLFGNGGDELLSVSPAYSADLLLAGRLRSHLAAVAAWVRSEGGLGHLGPRDIARYAGLRPALAQLASRLLSPAPTLERRLRERRWQRRLARLVDDTDHLRAISTDLAEARQSLRGSSCYARSLASDRVAAIYATECELFFSWGFDHGIMPLMPYFDRDLVDHLAVRPPEQLIAGGYQKAPLRRLVGERLPALGADRPKVDFTAILHNALRTDIPAVWRRLGGAPALSGFGGFSRNRTEAAVEAYLTGESDDWVTVWPVLAAESWLQARA